MTIQFLVSNYSPRNHRLEKTMFTLLDWPRPREQKRKDLVEVFFLFHLQFPDQGYQNFGVPTSTNRAMFQQRFVEHGNVPSSGYH